jgi:hypothetical protein
MLFLCVHQCLVQGAFRQYLHQMAAILSRSSQVINWGGCVHRNMGSMVKKVLGWRFPDQICFSLVGA